VHISLQVLFNAGFPPIKTVGLPGIHGATVLGTQGAGVNITGGGRFVAGFATLLHIPNGGILAMGLLSIIVATGVPVKVVCCELTIKVDGVVPNEHIILAPMHTQTAILSPPGTILFYLPPLYSKKTRD
jgi:hypothetical protein